MDVQNGGGRSDNRRDKGRKHRGRRGPAGAGVFMPTRIEIDVVY